MAEHAMVLTGNAGRGAILRADPIDPAGPWSGGLAQRVRPRLDRGRERPLAFDGLDADPGGMPQDRPFTPPRPGLSSGLDRNAAMTLPTHPQRDPDVAMSTGSPHGSQVAVSGIEERTLAA